MTFRTCHAEDSSATNSMGLILGLEIISSAFIFCIVIQAGLSIQINISDDNSMSRNMAISSKIHKHTESQNHSSWKGHLEMILSNSFATSRFSRVGYTSLNSIVFPI